MFYTQMKIHDFSHTHLWLGFFYIRSTSNVRLFIVSILSYNNYFIVVKFMQTVFKGKVERMALIIIHRPIMTIFCTKKVSILVILN